MDGFYNMCQVGPAPAADLSPFLARMVSRRGDAACAEAAAVPDSSLQCISQDGTPVTLVSTDGRGSGISGGSVSSVPVTAPPTGQQTP